MTVTGADMLKRLGSGVRPDGAVRPGATPVGSAGFQDLLRRAERGELASGRPVSAAPGVKPAIEPADLARLGPIADAAEAAGAERIIAVLGDVPVLLNVADRKVESAGPALRGRVLDDVDAVVVVPRAEEDEIRAMIARGGESAGERTAPVVPGSGFTRNGSVASLLASLERDTADGAEGGIETLRAGQRGALPAA